MRLKVIGVLLQLIFSGGALGSGTSNPLFLQPDNPAYTYTGPISNQYPDLLDAGVEELVPGLEQGKWTSVDLVNAYILRIHEVQDQLKAVTEINPDALEIAAALDEERLNGKVRSKLHGLPLLIKDNIATKDKTNTTAGSYALLGSKVPRDSTVVAKLRAAGVIILGKANLSEWAFARSSNTSSGWSAYGGQTIGAYHHNQQPCGSSSGSGVASSVGLALASLGTETHGSIVCPSGFNNLVGIKPTIGLTSRYMVVPISERMDTVGPMARTVTDAAHILSIIAGKDGRDNYTSAQPFNTPPDYTKSLNISSLQGARIGIPRNGIDRNSVPDSIMDAFEAAIQELNNAGAIIVDNANFPIYNVSDPISPRGDDNETIVFDGDMLSDFPKYLGELIENPNSIKTLDDIRNFTRNFPLEQYPLRDTATWDRVISRGYNNTDHRVWKAYQYITNLGGPGGITGAIENYGLDALILPSVISPTLPAYAGLPILTVPMGFYPADEEVVSDPVWGLVQRGPNIPFGLSFLGPKWSEQTLIGLAYAFEQHTQIRRQVQPFTLPKSQLQDVVR